VKAAAEEAVQRWAVETIVTIIPSAGTSVIATTTAELIAFAKSVYDRVKPILEYVQDAKEVLGNAGLRTDCGWSDWGRI
ncbi:hypothetical protein JZU56_03700, partial [bacterium]|nr:hypothetical protein [bacterium]